MSQKLIQFLERARMIGERDHEDVAVRWELEDPATISIPPPFKNGILHYNQLHHQQCSSMEAASIAEDVPSRWDDDQNYGLIGSEVDDSVAGTTDRGVHFPITSQRNGFSCGQLSQAPLQYEHSRYIYLFDRKNIIKCDLK